MREEGGGVLEARSVWLHTDILSAWGSQYDSGGGLMVVVGPCFFRVQICQHSDIKLAVAHETYDAPPSELAL